ncbi:MAG TPA: ferritin family protein [Candidatus Binatia bacterium]|nr:ferritin family protein [Candidatus Binatia bacterium]
MQRSFVSLSPQEALQVAISIEERNAEIYHRFAELFTEFGDEESLEIAAVFWEMAVEERAHRSLLRDKYAELYGDSVCHITEQDVIEIVEVPRLENGDVFAAGTDRAPGRIRALNVALQAELRAQQFYLNLVDRTPRGPLHSLFQDLAQIEDSHVSYLGAKLVQDTAERPSVH